MPDSEGYPYPGHSSEVRAMDLPWPVADTCRGVLAELDATQQRLTAATIENDHAESFRTLTLEIFKDLRMLIGRLESDDNAQSVQGSSGLPTSIQREAISVLDRCERILSTIRRQVEEGAVNVANIAHSSPESALVQGLKGCYDRLNIVLDLSRLSSTNLLGSDENIQSSNGAASPGTSKADMLVTIARMRGLFTSDITPQEVPPTYDEAVQDRPHLATEEKAQDISPSCAARKAVDTKRDSNHASTSTHPVHGEPSKSSSIKATTRPSGGSFTATKLTSIQTAPCNDIDGLSSTRCISGKDGGKLALTTPLTNPSALEVYNATSGSLLWKLEGNSPLFTQQSVAPISFTRFFKFSPDGSLLCAEIMRITTSRELLVLDSQEGSIITRRNLADNDGTVPQFSPDNTKVALFNWDRGMNSFNHIKVFPIDAASNENVNPSGSCGGSMVYSFNMIPIPKLKRGCGIKMSFTPDSKHIITCEGTAVKPDNNSGHAPFSFIIRVYRCTLSGGEQVHVIHHPGSPPSTNPFYQTWTDLALGFHFPSQERWLVSIPDFTDNVCNTRILEATTGETVALVSAERTLWQSWKSGVLSPFRVETAFDEATGLWTRMELTKTLLPPGQTATVTRFALRGSWRRGTLKELEDAWAAARSEVVVVNAGPDDLCDLSIEGTKLVVRRVATHQVDVWSIGG